MATTNPYDRREPDEHKRGMCAELDALRRDHAALLNVETAARELDALFGGTAGAWILDGQDVDGEAASALLSLHDYLNDVLIARQPMDYFNEHGCVPTPARTREEMVEAGARGLDELVRSATIGRQSGSVPLAPHAEAVLIAAGVIQPEDPAA